MVPMSDTSVSISSRAPALRVSTVSEPLRQWCPNLPENPSANTTYIFSFPFAGGGASAFSKWSSRFPEHIQICPVQYPGRENRWGQPLASNLLELIQELADTFDGKWPRSFAFLGHSFGALVAFELARKLVDQGQTPPLRLFMTGARAPHLALKESIHKLEDDRFLVKLRQYDGLPAEILSNDDLLKVVVPVIKNDFRLFEEHRFQNQPLLPVPISAFGAIDDRNVSIADVLAWSSLTSKTFRARFLKGNHFFLFDAIASVAPQILDDLEASNSGAAYRNQSSKTRNLS